MGTQIITLIGVLFGALTSYLATTAAERSRFRRSMATRWDERKLNAYVEYVSCVKSLARHSRLAIQARRDGQDPTQHLTDMDAAEAQRSTLFEQIVLLGSDDAATAAGVVNRRVWDLVEATHGSVGEDISAPSRGSLVVDALNVMHRAARADLALGGSRV